MMLLESQARSEDLYAWAVKRSSRCGLTAPLSSLALGDNPLPPPPPLSFTQTGVHSLPSFGVILEKRFFLPEDVRQLTAFPGLLAHLL